MLLKKQTLLQKQQKETLKDFRQDEQDRRDRKEAIQRIKGKGEEEGNQTGKPVPTRGGDPDRPYF